ncbi:TPA: tRNA (adenosine(37)-N6)-threonylcarbamoyltransferase complex ATPase subunit type 1 TsaE [Streptococcus suis]
MQVKISRLEETQDLAQKIASQLKAGDLVELKGPLGVGKTTFTQALGKALGVKRPIKSPTYAIVKEYPLDPTSLVHIDAYRLEEGGAETVDISLYLEGAYILVVEWAQFLEDYLPEDRLVITFEKGQGLEERLITIESVGSKAPKIELELI